MFVRHPEIFKYVQVNNPLSFVIPPTWDDFSSGKFLGKYFDYTTDNLN
jgi:hypothetical protein